MAIKAKIGDKVILGREWWDLCVATRGLVYARDLWGNLHDREGTIVSILNRLDERSWMVRVRWQCEPDTILGRYPSAQLQTMESNLLDLASPEKPGRPRTRCKCEHLGCQHEPGICRHEASLALKIDMLGPVCPECYRRYGRDGLTPWTPTARLAKGGA